MLQAKDLLANVLSWDTLKRVLRSGEIRIENIGEQHTPLPTTSMRPQPIPVSAKIVLIGGPGTLRVLQSADEDFRRYFKVTADFDTVMDRTPENIASYAAFVASEAAHNGLSPFDKTAVAAIVDYSSRLVEDQQKLTTRFMHVSDVLTEADYWARKSGCESVKSDRETRMSGRIHNKGFMILNGFFQGKYGKDRRLSMSASLTFEQTYSDVEGDSASSTELYALLSELSGVPVKQSIAVTGSVNQTGEVQSMGGATYKIECFFDVCRAKGLTGEQGVMIPKDNVRNLALSREVVQAVEDRRFHVYAVSTIDEGIEVLTGVEAGEMGQDGKYPEGTIHSLVESRLEDMGKKARQSGPRQRDSENEPDDIAAAGDS